MDLFGFGREEKESLEDNLPGVGEFTEEQLLANEKEVLGLYVSGHPLENTRSTSRQGHTQSFDSRRLRMLTMGIRR